MMILCFVFWIFGEYEKTNERSSDATTHILLIVCFSGEFSQL